MIPNNIFLIQGSCVRKNEDGLWVFLFEFSSLVDIPAGSAS